MKTSDTVKIGHALPRRVRLAAPLLAGRRAACERVARALAAGGAFARVTVRPATGSVLIEDDQATIDARALVERVREIVQTERDEQGRLLVALGPEDHPGPTRIARAVVRAVSDLNAEVRERLDHRADLGTLLPVIFAAAGLAELGTTGRMPVPTWFNLLWWSMRSFMTFNIRAVEDEVQDGPEHGMGEIRDAL